MLCRLNSSLTTMDLRFVRKRDADRTRRLEDESCCIDARLARKLLLREANDSSFRSCVAASRTEGGRCCTVATHLDRERPPRCDDGDGESAAPLNLSDAGDGESDAGAASHAALVHGDTFDMAKASTR